mmetsp:Transcript_25287/g.38351  ORF Transcript_25287/g.38351 Transcript_25287/m.38351 type:complete len:257 (+) Transcript_25287:126-896(+)
MTGFIVGIFDQSYFYVKSKESDSAGYIVSLASLIRYLSIWRNLKGTAENLTLEVSVRSIDVNGPLHQLQTHHSFLHTTSATRLKILKKSQGVFLVIYESWETVNYLQISNSSGYGFTMNGALFFPNGVNDSERNAELFLKALARNSLWTNGQQVLNNTGRWSTVRETDIGEDISWVALSVKCSSDLPSRVENSNWRQIIEGSLKRHIIDFEKIKTEEMRLNRREYLMEKSIAVINKLSDECEYHNFHRQNGKEERI